MVMTCEKVAPVELTFFRRIWPTDCRMESGGSSEGVLVVLVLSFLDFVMRIEEGLRDITA
jgi:hypothetical protein